MTERVDRLLRSIDVASEKGLELGPLVNPVVRRDMGDISYIDHVDTDGLRARYASHVGFDVDAIVPIDYVSSNGSVREAIDDGVVFDYVIASHVIEHVPDLIHWLRDIRSVMRDGGVFSLAIPDHRCCFDALRSPTVTAEVVQAHLTGSTVPSPRQVFDHYSSAVAWKGLISWDSEVPFSELVPVHSEPYALDRAKAVVASGEYDDVHCWVFTPSSFTRLYSALQRLQLVPFSLEEVSESISGEFFVRLRAADEAGAVVPEPVDDGVPIIASEHAAVRADLRDVRARCESTVIQLRQTLASRSWKVTTPLRALNRLRSRRR